MNLSISKAEQAAVAELKKVWQTASADFKAEIAWLSKAEMGLIGAHPWLYSGTVFAAGIGAGVALTLAVLAAVGL